MPQPATKTPSRALPPAWLGWLVWGLGALFYLSGFYQRVAPAVMTSELMADFSISAAQLGNLSAFYFYAYVAMQIPTGILSDWWGPRKLLTAGAVVAGAGTLVFAWAPALGLAYLGRLMIGGSVAVAFVVLLGLANHWFPPQRFAMVSGLALFCGVVGAVGAGVPLRLMVDAFGWRPVMAVSGAVSLALAVAVWLFVRNDPTERGYASYAPDSPGLDRAAPRVGVLTGLGRVLAYRNTWLIFFAGGGMVGPVLTFAGLWGVPYLAVRYGLHQAEGAAICSLLMICWAVGGPVLGALSDRIGRRRPLYLGGAVVAFAGWMAMIYLPVPLWLFVTLTVVAGLAAGGMIISFAMAKESVPPPLAGTVSGVVNMGVMMGPTLMQPLIGKVLDAVWAGGMAGGVPVYRLEAYNIGFVLLVGWAGLSCVMMLLTKETYCRQME